MPDLVSNLKPSLLLKNQKWLPKRNVLNHLSLPNPPPQLTLIENQPELAILPTASVMRIVSLRKLVRLSNASFYHRRQSHSSLSQSHRMPTPFLLPYIFFPFLSILPFGNELCFSLIAFMRKWAIFLSTITSTQKLPFCFELPTFFFSYKFFPWLWKLHMFSLILLDSVSLYTRTVLRPT